MRNPVDPVHPVEKIDYTARAIAGAASAPLTNEQKARLAMLARDGFDKHGKMTGMSFDDFRHEQTAIACGKESLRACVNADFESVKAHFLMIAGRPVAAFRAAVKSQTNDRTMARAKLEAEYAQVADVLPNARAYAAGFLRNKRGIEIEDATAKDLWHTVFMIRRRAQQLRRAKKKSEVRSQRSEFSGQKSEIRLTSEALNSDLSASGAKR